MKKFLSNTKGVAAVEFALTVGLFLFVFFMNFELSRLVLTSSYLDLGIAQSVRVSRNAQAEGHNYEKVFRESLQKYLSTPQDTVMRFFLYTSTVDFSVKDNSLFDIKYVNCGTDSSTCVRKLLAGDFVAEKFDSKGNSQDLDGNNVVLAVYNLKLYNFKFDTALPFLPDSWINNTLKRQFIMVQEYERSSFK